MLTMPFFDLSPEELENYQADTPEPNDFDVFWQETLAAAREVPLQPTFEQIDVGLRTMTTIDVTFQGYGGQPIKGWLVYPRAATAPLPCIVEFIGYGGGRAYPENWLLWPSAGYATFVMDTRGQGSGWTHGDTPDTNEGDSPSLPSFMTRGILDKNTYFYRRVYTDAVRALETAQLHKMVDGSRLAVSGGSQGGALSIAAAGLAPDLVKIAMPDVPFLCDFRRVLKMPVEAPYSDLLKYLSVHRHREQEVLLTLNYFDNVHMAKRITAESLFSVALMDFICPPSTVYGAYNHVKSHKEIRIYTYNNHEGGQYFQNREKVNFVHKRWADYALPL